MKAIDRLNQLKNELEDGATIERFVSLTNPKNVSLMEALVAWTCIKVAFDGEAEVNENTTFDDLWQYSTMNVKEFSDTAGIVVTDGLAKLRQLKNLKLIFPDGSCLSKALSIVKVYVKGKIEDLS